MKLLMRIVLLSAIALTSAVASIAQSEVSKGDKKQPKFDRSRWVYGGNVSAVFGNVTILGANPSVGYRLTQKLTTGVGGMYYYWKPAGFVGTSVYGPTSYMRLNVGQSLLSDGDRLFAQTDYYILNTRIYNVIDDEIRREWVQQFFVGGGYYMQIGQNVFAGITVQVDLIQDPNSFFRSPYIGGGVSIGL